MACYRHHCRDAVGLLSVTPPAVGPIYQKLSGRYLLPPLTVDPIQDRVRSTSLTIGPILWILSARLKRYRADMAFYRHHCRDDVCPLSVTPPAVGPIPDRPLSLSGRYCGFYQLDRSAIEPTWFSTALSGRYLLPPLTVDPITDRPCSLSVRYCGLY
jgi:hypothetical protein